MLAWLRRRAHALDGDRDTLLGDDGAVLTLNGEAAVTVDQQIEGVHFLAGRDPALVARRLLRVNLSDLAAMGARPAHAFLALAAPQRFDHRRFFRALLAEARRFGVRLAGGDLASAAAVHASLMLIGGRRRGSRWLRRGAARPGDDLWIGGTLGESAAGLRLLGRGVELRGARLAAPASLPARLRPAASRAVRRHLLPEPQLELSAWLARQNRSAALDVSDGLARDLHRLCRESGVGARLELDALPLAPGAGELADWLGADPFELALAGGEDYVLLFTLPAGAAPPTRHGCRRIGRVRRARRLEMNRGGELRPLEDVGFDHLAGAEARPGLRPRPASARRLRRDRAAPRRPPG